MILCCGFVDSCVGVVYRKETIKLSLTLCIFSLKHFVAHLWDSSDLKRPSPEKSLAHCALEKWNKRMGGSAVACTLVGVCLLTSVPRTSGLKPYKEFIGKFHVRRLTSQIGFECFWKEAKYPDWHLQVPSLKCAINNLFVKKAEPLQWSWVMLLTRSVLVLKLNFCSFEQQPRDSFTFNIFDFLLERLV